MLIIILGVSIFIILMVFWSRFLFANIMVIAPHIFAAIHIGPEKSDQVSGS